MNVIIIIIWPASSYSNFYSVVSLYSCVCSVIVHIMSINANDYCYCFLIIISMMNDFDSVAFHYSDYSRVSLKRITGHAGDCLKLFILKRVCINQSMINTISWSHKPHPPGD